METLVAYKGDQSVKTKYLTRIKAHEKADEIVKGKYWEGGKGCAVGCTIEGSDHSRYETELGIPTEVAYLEDVIFEELPNGEAQKFPAQFLSSIKVGADLSQVVAKMVIWQFEDETHGLRNIKEVSEDKELMGWCKKVVDLYRLSMTEKVPLSEYEKLYLEIDGAQARGARAWAGAQARGARAWAWAGARAWAWARARGARARAWAWAWARAWARAGAEYDARIIAMRDEFLHLLSECE